MKQNQTVKNKQSKLKISKKYRNIFTVLLNVSIIDYSSHKQSKVAFLPYSYAEVKLLKVSKSFCGVSHEYEWKKRVIHTYLLLCLKKKYKFQKL